MLLDITHIFENEGETLPFAFGLDLSDVQINGVFPFSEPVPMRGKVQNVAQTVFLTAEAAFDLKVPCDRCAEEYEQQHRYTFSHPLAMQLRQEEQDEYLLVPDGQLDLAALLHADVLLALPSKYLCKDDCKGLCPVCGTNFNNGSCRCNQRQTDPRFEVLRQLIDKDELKEVFDHGGTKE